MGESGSGKSTLALAALGLMPSTAGTLRSRGRAGAGTPPANSACAEQVQVVFQDPFSSLSPRMTVEEIVGEGLLVHEPGLMVRTRRERVLAALAEVGLTRNAVPGPAGALPA
jgi:microcin C transport system ATP-binding protein